MAELARKVRSYNEIKLNVVTYTGYTFEQLISLANEENGFMELLKETDYLIDGRFVLAERRLELKFRGSRNQRFIDVQRSLKEGKAVVLDYEALSLM